MQRRLGILTIFLSFAFVALCTVPVFSHTIIGANGEIVDYSDWEDPATGWNCCNSTDCSPYPSENVREGRHDDGTYGYFLATGEFIPMARVIPSPDAQFHRCVYHYDVASVKAKKGDTRCFAAPMGQS